MPEVGSERDFDDLQLLGAYLLVLFVNTFAGEVHMETLCYQIAVKELERGVPD